MILLVLLVGYLHTQGAESFFSFDWPWGAGVVITGTVSGTNPCGHGVGEMIFLRPKLGLS